MRRYGSLNNINPSVLFHLLGLKKISARETGEFEIFKKKTSRWTKSPNPV